MAEDDTSLSTIDPGQRLRAVSARPQLVLTIAYHPDTTRVGERHHLDAHAAVGRLEPDFVAAGALEPRPLGDRNISRKPVMIHSEARGARIDASGTTTPLRVDGEALTQCHLGHERIDRGVVLELADRVVLLLQRMTSLGPARPRHGMVGASEALGALWDEIDRVARRDVPVLIRGESGVGKELVARAIHAASKRAGRPFVAVNMAAVPPSTAAAELFGHARGAYTGAVGAHGGFFGEAEGGTLFLDEVGATPLELQAMLLRALESGEVQPVGEQRSRAVDVRVVTATDEPLEEAVARGAFRLPLLHRLAGYELAVPPLRARRDDIAALLLHFLREGLAGEGEAARLDDPGPQRDLWLPAPVVARLLRHDWPGNVRELRNIARRLVIHGAGRASVAWDDTLEAMLSRHAERDAPRAAEIDDERLIAALSQHRWEVAATARSLGVPKTTLYRLMDQCEGIRRAHDLSREEIAAAQRECRGKLGEMAMRLRVSRVGLRKRMTQLEMG